MSTPTPCSSAVEAGLSAFQEHVLHSGEGRGEDRSGGVLVAPLISLQHADRKRRFAERYSKMYVTQPDIASMVQDHADAFASRVADNIGTSVDVYVCPDAGLQSRELDGSDAASACRIGFIALRWTAYPDTSSIRGGFIP